MKKLIVILSVVVLAGCTDRARIVNFSAMPPELLDCKVYAISNSNGEHITVMRCPNSTTSTTYPSGKTTKSTIVIDGETYEKKE